MKKTNKQTEFIITPTNCEKVFRYLIKSLENYEKATKTKETK